MDNPFDRDDSSDDEDNGVGLPVDEEQDPVVGTSADPAAHGPPTTEVATQGPGPVTNELENEELGANELDLVDLATDDLDIDALVTDALANDHWATDARARDDLSTVHLATNYLDTDALSTDEWDADEPTPFRYDDQSEQQHPAQLERIESRRRLLAEQDQRYLEAFEKDQEKERKKRIEEAEKKRAEDEYAKAEELRLEEEARIKAEQDKVRATLVAEPPKDSGESICIIRFRYANGKVVTRRFLQTSVLSDIFDFLFSEGYGIGKYKVLLGISVPKRDLTKENDFSLPIGSIFDARDTVHVEERF